MFKPEVKSKVGEDISLLIQLDNHAPSYICECGSAADLSVKDCQNAEAIFISHTHIDHFINFDTILRHQIGINKRVVVCGVAPLIEQVQAKIKAYSWNLIEDNAIVYEVREVAGNVIRRAELRPSAWDIVPLEAWEGNVIYSNDRFQVEYTLLDHKLPTMAYLFRERDTYNIDLTNSPYKGGAWVRALKTAFEQQAGETVIEIEGKAHQAQDLFHLLACKRGDSVGIVMDHAANEANHARIKALFSGCNRVFIECFYKAEDKAFADLNFHSYSEASGEVMRACGVQEAIPVHFSRKYDEAEVAQLVQEFQNALKGTRLS